MSWKGGNTRAVIQDLFGIHTHTVMLAATGMHVGKTTLSLGVFRGLQSKWGHGRVAYCKPLGQRYKDILLPDGRAIKVDPDVETVRNYFQGGNEKIVTYYSQCNKHVQDTLSGM